MNPPSLPPPQCPASSMQPWARTPIGPLIWTPVWRLGCVNVYIFIDGGVVLLLIDYCLFVTSSLLRDPPGCLGHISPTSIRLLFLFFLKNHCRNVDIAAVRLLLCSFDRGGMPYTSVLNLLLLFLAWWFRFKTNQMYWKNPFPSQIFIPQILKHHFKKKEWICSSKAASRGRPAQPGTISTRWASESRKTRVEKTNTGPAGTLWPHSFELRTGPSP